MHIDYLRSNGALDPTLGQLIIFYNLTYYGHIIPASICYNKRSGMTSKN